MYFIFSSNQQIFMILGLTFVLILYRAFSKTSTICLYPQAVARCRWNGLRGELTFVLILYPALSKNSTICFNPHAAASVCGSGLGEGGANLCIDIVSCIQQDFDYLFVSACRSARCMGEWLRGGGANLCIDVVSCFQ